MKIKEKTSKVFLLLEKENLQTETELSYVNPYTLLVAVVLSAQSTDIGVNKATKNLFKKIKSPIKMIKLGEKRLIGYIKTIGLYRNKAKNIIALSRILHEKHNSAVPSSMDELTQLPGVGRKTANVVMNVIFDKPTIAVDTHVFRVSNRLGIGLGKTPEEVEKKLLNNVPEKYLKDAHHWLIMFGRYKCKAQNPLCDECKLIHFCSFYKKEYVKKSSINNRSRN
jgi:endonuclease-3